MINLLPTKLKEMYRFGRRNRHLTHWIIALAIGIVGAALITGVGYIYLNQTADNYKRQIQTSNEQLAAQNLTGVQNEVKDISNNLTLALEVLSKQVLFSELLEQLATLMPASTNLTGLSISQTEGAIDIAAEATTYEAAAQIQVNLTDPDNRLFSSADIITIGCSGEGAYPCSVQLRALFADNSSYLFTSDTGAN